MRKISSFYAVLCFFIFGLFLIPKMAFSTHIRAGEIVAERIDCQGFTYRFYLIAYTDAGSPIPFGNGVLRFGDGTSLELNDGMVTTVPYDTELLIDKNTFETTHTFSGPGVFVVSYSEPNRNDNILNMDNSVNTPFYIETMIVIDNFVGCNDTPKLLIPPIDQGCSQTLFMHNAGAYDADGDSISYEFVIPRQDVDNTVTNYRYPNEKEFYDIAGIDYEKGNEANNGRPTFTLDPLTGDVTWDAPGISGEYNFAFRIVEWRKIGDDWIRLGYVTRDMQVIIDDCSNNRPEIEIPDDICVEIGSTIIEDIIANNGEGDGENKNEQVKLEAFSQVFEFIGSAKATFDVPSGFQNSPLTGEFKWENISCNVVRRQPYQVFFKVTDKPEKGVSLTSFETWNITVVASAPSFQTVTRNGRSATLNWTNYVAEYGCTEANVMQIWRRVESNNFTPDDCETGMPTSAGYQKIAEVDINEDTFIDTGLAYGAKYCYRLVAGFPEPKGGESYVSDEICIDPIEADAPVPTHVTVDETDNTNGLITVSWRKPFDIDFGFFAEPLRYEVYRGEGFGGEANTLIATTTDTTFQDSGLNTDFIPYNYVIKAFDDNNVEIDQSVPASSVWLDVYPDFESITIQWEANVPWSNNVPGLLHEVFRTQIDPGNSDALVKIADIDPSVTGLSFLDDGSHNGEVLDNTLEYCYLVKTSGSYGNPKIDIPQINFSQIICGQLKDTIPPCAPFLKIDTLVCRPINDFSTDITYTLDDQSCGLSDYENTLTWELPDNECGQDIRVYNVYYKREINEEYRLIATTPSLSYVHDNLSSFAGCYKIVAVDRSGNESVDSNEVCKDNCPNFYLPNVFTPENLDGSNDVFRTYDEFEDSEVANILLKCPRFVKSVEFKVFNKWGRMVYSYTSGVENPISINWNGKDDNGNQLPAAVYNYQAIVEFDMVDPEKKTQTFKGFVHLVR